MTTVEGPGPDTGPGAELVAELRRWQESGAVWRVLHRDDDLLTVALFTCDGGEEMRRATSRDPPVRAFIGDRLSSED